MALAERYDPASTTDVLCAQAKALAERGQQQLAESVYLRAKRPELALKMYREARLYQVCSGEPVCSPPACVPAPPPSERAARPAFFLALTSLPALASALALAPTPALATRTRYAWPKTTCLAR